jgi:beta-lactamase regulating signal transducer with metallopeptidase domain
MFAVAWMLTYLLHSTLLLGLAALASKRLARWSVAAEEVVWKAALVGAIFTVSLQLAAGWQPLAGQWRLADATPAQSLSTPAPQPNVGAGLVPARAAERLAPAAEFAPARSLASQALPASPPAAPSRSLASLPSLSSFSLTLLTAWACGALLLLLAFGRSYLRLGRRLKHRPRVVAGDLHAQLRALAAEAGLEGAVRLSCSSRAPVPLALGFGRPEICVPPRAFAGLTSEQQEGMLAHELAHLARRDPFWLVLGQVIACLLFFQPLNWVARRRLREISEMLSDEWAVARTGRPLSLAGCLAEVAGWSVGHRRLPVPSMADRPSSLGVRIRRLLDEARSPEHPARRAWLAAAMGVLVIAAAAAAPAISAARPEPPPAQPVAPAASTAPGVDVKDATDTPTHPQQAEEAGRRSDREDGDSAAERAAMKAKKDRDEQQSDVEQAERAEQEAREASAASREIEVPDVDVKDMETAEAIDARVSASLQTALGALDGQLGTLSAEHQLTHEQQEKLSRDIERSTREIEKTLKPRLEKLSRELATRMSHLEPNPEMLRLTAEMAKLGEQMRPSEADMARMRAKMDQEMKALKIGEGEKLTAEQREKIRHAAKEMAEAMKPSPEIRRQMDQVRAQLQKERAERSEHMRTEDRQEIDQIRREIHEEVEREMAGMREELHQALAERKAIEQGHHDPKIRKEHEPRHEAPKPPAPPKPSQGPDDNG